MNVAVVGASRKPERYSYQAVFALKEKGHVPYPVHPSLESVDDIPVYRSLESIPDAIDTVTVYLSAKNQNALKDDIIRSGARRVIFNPGAENAELAEELEKAGVEYLNACTLVMLATGQF